MEHLSHEVKKAWGSPEAGWMIECACGFLTFRNPLLEDSGAQFDDHIADLDLQKNGPFRLVSVLQISPERAG
jgi:hypothetical protein